MLKSAWADFVLFSLAGLRELGWLALELGWSVREFKRLVLELGWLVLEFGDLARELRRSVRELGRVLWFGLFK